MQSNLELENLQLRKLNLELQSRLMQVEHSKIDQRIKELENARPVSDNRVLQPHTLATD